MAKSKFLPQIIYDPIWQVIKINEEIISDLIKTIEFQRLANIRQLGTAVKVFPSATHTRFNHSLGAYEIMRRILEDYNIVKNKKSVNKKEKTIALCAALLHDFGHGPWSHLSEKILPDFNHEEQRNKMIKNPNGQIYQTLKKHHLEPEEIIRAYKQNSIYQLLIDSIIDVDKIDYLLRDSHATNVHYGNLELPYLLMSPGAMTIDFEKKIMIFNQNLIDTVEHFLFARYFMYKNVYYNSKIICYDFIIEKIMLYLREHSNNDNGLNLPETLKNFCQWTNNTEINIFLTFNEQTLETELLKLYYTACQQQKAENRNFIDTSHPVLWILLKLFFLQKPLKFEFLNTSKNKTSSISDKYKNLKLKTQKKILEKDYKKYLSSAGTIQISFFKEKEIENVRVSEINKPLAKVLRKLPILSKLNLHFKNNKIEQPYLISYADNE